jgi:hypothetical protein
MIVLGVATTAGCVAFLLPVRRLNDERPARVGNPGAGERMYDTPRVVGDHTGRHRWTDDEDTSQLGDGRMHSR